MTVYLNGQFLPADQAKISVLDRGFIFGDGVYEVWRSVEGKLFENDRHLRRLKRGLKTLEISVPDTDVEALPGVGERLLQENGLSQSEGSFYIEITRGPAPRTHAYPNPPAKPTIFGIVSKFDVPHALREGGAKAITVPDIRWHMCDVKAVQLLPNCMAKQKAQVAGAMEAIFVRDGIVTEGTHTTVMGVKNGELRTHPLGNFILPSVTREVVLEIAKEQGVRVREDAFTETDLFAMDELFACGTLTDVTPLVEVDGKKIASGKPGPVTKALYAGMQARLYAGSAVAQR